MSKSLGQLVPVKPKSEILPADQEVRTTLLANFRLSSLVVVGGTAAGSLAGAGQSLYHLVNMLHIASTGTAGAYTAFIPQHLVQAASAAGISPFLILDLATGYIGTKIVLWITGVVLESSSRLKRLREGPSIALPDYRKMIDG